jgi:hypothetical protein
LDGGKQFSELMFSENAKKLSFTTKIRNETIGGHTKNNTGFILKAVKNLLSRDTVPLS